MSIMVFSPQLSATSYGFKVYGVPIKFNSFLDAGLISDVSTGLVFHAPLSRQAKYALTSQKLTYSGSPSFGQVDGKWCATFNGENYVNFSTDNIPTGAGIRTMTAWVKCTGNSGERTVVIYGDANTSCSYGFSIWPEYRKIRLIGWGDDIDSADNSFSLNEWHLIVSTYDGSKYKGYIDCELVGEAVKSLNTTSNSSRHYIGGMGSDNPFIGSISDVRIYNRVLSDKDMKALFRMGPYDDHAGVDPAAVPDGTMAAPWIWDDILDTNFNTRQHTVKKSYVDDAGLSRRGYAVKAKLKAGVEYRIGLQAPFDTWIGLYSESGSELASNDDEGWDIDGQYPEHEYNSAISYTPNSDGWYIIGACALGEESWEDISVHMSPAPESSSDSQQSSSSSGQSSSSSQQSSSSSGQQSGSSNVTFTFSYDGSNGSIAFTPNGTYEYNGTTYMKYSGTMTGGGEYNGTTFYLYPASGPYEDTPAWIISHNETTGWSSSDWMHAEEGGFTNISDGMEFEVMNIGADYGVGTLHVTAADDSSSSSGSTSRFPEQVIFNMTQGFTGKFSGTFSKTNETTTVEGVSYPVYSGHMYDYEMNSETEEWQVFSDYDTKLFACKVTDEADSSIIRYWWMFGSTALSENTIFDGYMGRGKYSTTEIPELTNEGWVDSAAMAYEYWTIDSSTITIVNGSSGGNQSSSSSDSGGSQPSQSVTKITITSSGSPADGEWTLNTSTGSYEKGGLRLECVQDALYAWQIWDREMPEYPDLYYSTGYTFQTNNVSEILGTMEWHDVKLDDPITLTLTDTSPNSSGGESSSSSSESSSSSGGAVSGINFTGTYSEDFSFTYTGTFTQTNRTIDVTEWNTQSNETMSTPYHVMSGSFHKVGHEIDYENDSEIPVDEYVTLWLVPAMNPPTYYEWLNSDDSGKVEWANDPDAMAPYYSWGIIEAADCGNEVKCTDGCLGYISEQRYTMPMIQTGDHVYSENAGGWDNTSITVN